MATQKFRTNAKCGGCSAKIGAALEQNGVPAGGWSLDLAAPEKWLTVDSELAPEAIVRIVTEAGFKAEEVR
ncbi:heavy-metal-associated domain-containing protein [Rikenella microfusus]|uniref:heavy-metal-associated domain-containing protein n=1 Tax=Rikenella microfusus TaxID=28139 RepID=UPI00248F22CA|nr:heavy metal transport/detoxification protein [Rikenella microfusus]